MSALQATPWGRVPLSTRDGDAVAALAGAGVEHSSHAPSGPARTAVVVLSGPAAMLLGLVGAHDGTDPADTVARALAERGERIGLPVLLGADFDCVLTPGGASRLAADGAPQMRGGVRSDARPAAVHANTPERAVRYGSQGPLHPSTVATATQGTGAMAPGGVQPAARAGSRAPSEPSRHGKRRRVFPAREGFCPPNRDGVPMVPNANARHYLIKAKQRDLIAAAGGIERAAAVCDRSKSVVGRWSNPDSPEWIDLPAIFALEEECGRYDMSEAIAALRGRSFADAAVAGGDANASIMARHAEAMVQVGELAAVAAMAFSDGRLTPAEASQIDRAASALERAIAELRKATAGARGEGGISLVRGGRG